LKQKQTLICFETEDQLINPRYPTEPVLARGGIDSGLPPPFLVATGQTGHAVVGLDIGTKFSRLAAFESDEFQLLTSAPMMSIAGRLSNGNLTVGVPPTGDTVNVIQHFRNLIGTDWFVEAECGFYSAEMFTSLLIQRLVAFGASTLGRPVSKAVLTTPVTFTSNQRKLLKAAGQEAEVDILQLLNEPTAAAFYHCYHELKKESNNNLLVYHLGAGTFAASVMEFQHGLLEVKSTIGDDNLSAESFVATVVDWMVDSFESDSGHKLEKTPSTVWRLIRAAEQAIVDLHTAGIAHVKVTNLEVQSSGPNLKSKTHAYLMATLSLTEYHELIEPIIAKTLEAVDRVLVDSNTNPNRIDQVLLLGDHRSLMPFFRRFYDRLPGATIFPASPNSYPVFGAALQAALLNNSIRDYVVWDVISEPVWVEEHGELKQVISRGTPLPITAYHKCESPDSTVNMHVVQGSEMKEKATLADITVSNCPPTTQGETKVEVHFIASADGIVDYRAKHIALDSMLPVSVIDGQPTLSHGFSETKRSKTFEESRLNRLARIMNTTPLSALNVLRARGYTIEAIKNGRAIEDMLRKLKLSRLEKNA
jgi:molecular chaperone DnaK